MVRLAVLGQRFGDNRPVPKPVKCGIIMLEGIGNERI
jgi:hypothetical protein